MFTVIIFTFCLCFTSFGLWGLRRASAFFRRLNLLVPILLWLNDSALQILLSVNSNMQQLAQTVLAPLRLFIDFLYFLLNVHSCSLYYFLSVQYFFYFFEFAAVTWLRFMKFLSFCFTGYQYVFVFWTLFYITQVHCDYFCSDPLCWLKGKSARVLAENAGKHDVVSLLSEFLQTLPVLIIFVNVLIFQVSDYPWSHSQKPMAPKSVFGNEIENVPSFLVQHWKIRPRRHILLNFGIIPIASNFFAETLLRNVMLILKLSWLVK